MDINKLTKLLHQEYIDPQTELRNWNNPIQFMVCVILSAQATDAGVNKITKELFDRYVRAEDFASAEVEEIVPYVKSINFYRSKSERIIKACKYIVEHMDGKLVPDINKLTKIPGIGRKSANVIINEALNGTPQGIVVDTHMIRVANRLRLTKYVDQKDAEKAESDLMSLIPQDEWKHFSASVVLHGRYICKAKKPKCEECILNGICPSAFTFCKEQYSNRQS